METARRRLAGVVVLLSLSAADPQISVAQTQRYPIEGQGTLELDIPAGWRLSAVPPSGEIPVILTLVTPSREAVMISVFTNARRDPDFTADATVRSLVEQDGRAMLPTAVEPELVLHELKGGSHTGYFYSLTDKSLVGKEPAPGTFRILTQGEVGVGKLWLFFTIFTNEETSPVRDAALRMVSTASHSMPASAPAAPAPR